jgi:hypothetical protein
MYIHNYTTDVKETGAMKMAEIVILTQVSSHQVRLTGLKSAVDKSYLAILRNMKSSKGCSKVAFCPFL